MERLDVRAEFGDVYRPPADPVLVEPPVLPYLMIDGAGNPNTAPAYAAAVEALYALSYAVKFAVKRGALAVDFKVMPLEGLWWAEDMRAFSTEAKDEWQWTLMIVQPAVVTPALVEDTREQTRRKKGLPALAEVRFEHFDEGLAAQVMHTGPYSAEGPVIERLHAFIAEQGYARAGKHHEIYLGDPRRSAPERLKTILRQPVAQA